MSCLHCQELPRMLETLNLLLPLTFNLTHTHSLTPLFLESHILGLGQDEYTQKDEEDCFVHLPTNKRYLVCFYNLKMIATLFSRIKKYFFKIIPPPLFSQAFRFIR